MYSDITYCRLERTPVTVRSIEMTPLYNVYMYSRHCQTNIDAYYPSSKRSIIGVTVLLINVQICYTSSQFVNDYSIYIGIAVSEYDML
jgi:hypothetical protein